MIKNLMVFVLCFGSFFFSKAQEDNILFHIDDTEVKVSEFEYIYNKNNFDNKADYSEASLREYLDLYINFRLKVKEAEALGLDKDAKLQSELSVYQEQLYNSFYDKNSLNDLLEEVEQRAKSDVAISHIFVSVEPDADQNKKAEAKRKIQSAYEALVSGLSFAEAAKKFSDDKYSADKEGYLGFFTALQIAFHPLENAAYNTAVGSYSKPVQTNIGYHIVKVNEKRPARGLVKTAIIKLNKKNSTSENAVVKEKLNALYERLKKGEDFATLAKANSDDKNTKADGGEMNWFGISQYEIDFENQAFSLKEKGDITKPFETKSAYYIIKLLDKKLLGENPSEKDALISRIKRSDRYQLQRKAHIDAILKQYGFERNAATYNSFKAKAINQFKSNQYKFDIENPSTLITVAGKAYTNKNFADYIYANQSKFRRLTGQQKFDKLYNNFVEEKATAFHIIEYGKENKEYGALLKEYRDGILLFDLMEKKVWSKAVEDSVGLLQYYEHNKEKFVSKEKAKVKKYHVPSIKTGKLLAKFLKVDPNLQNDKYLMKLEKKGVTTSFEALTVEKTDALVKQLDWKAKSCNILEDNGKYIVYQIQQIFPEEMRSFEDSKGFAIAGYQEYLEKEWLKELHQKYKVTVDENVLKGLIK